MTQADEHKQSESDSDRLADFAETDLPEDVTFEDALRGFTQVDPEAVKEAEKKEKKDRDDDASG